MGRPRLTRESTQQRAPLAALLIGAGFMGSVHSRALRAAGIEIAGIVSSTKEKGELAARSLGIEKSYASIGEALKDEKVTLVHVLTPNQSHAEIVDLALDAGKHVVCEKPLTVELEDAKHLAKKAQSLGLLGAIPFVYRYHAMARELKSKINQGQIGRLLSVKGEYLQDWLLTESDTNWRVDSSSGGPSRAFGDIGVHLCDLMEFVTGERIVRLVSKTKIAYDSRSGQPVSTEDLAAVIAELKGGSVASLMVSQVAAGHKNGLVLEIQGSLKALRFEQENPELLWVGGQNGNTMEHRNPNLLAPDAARITNLPAGHPEGYFDAFVSFVRDVQAAVQGDIPFGLPTFQDGVRSAELIDAVLKSSTSESWVTL